LRKNNQEDDKHKGFSLLIKLNGMDQDVKNNCFRDKYLMFDPNSCKNNGCSNPSFLEKVECWTRAVFGPINFDPGRVGNFFLLVVSGHIGSAFSGSENFSPKKTIFQFLSCWVKKMLQVESKNIWVGPYLLRGQKYCSG